MPNTANQKLRLLYLLKLLIQKTDLCSGLTTNQLLDELANVGIDTQRKSLYRDFKSMRQFGLLIEQNKSREWFLSNRPFDPDELVMLVDAVQSTPFLTTDMSTRLIGKLKAFASERDAKHLDGRIELSEYVKMANEDVFWNIKAIQMAISLKKKVEFKYFRYVADGGKLVRDIHHEHTAIPLKLVYADEKYYMLTFDERFNNMTPFRVDRMIDVVCSDEPIPRKRSVATWRLEDAAVLSFGIFGSEVGPVSFDIRSEWMNVVIDKFGTDLNLYDIDDGVVRVHVKAPLSPQFFGWLFQLGDNIKLVSPKIAIEEYKEYCIDILKHYE